MRRDRVRLVVNLAQWLTTCSAQELYLVARGIAEELENRGHDARLEAHALGAALLPDAQAEHRLACAAEEP